MCYTVLHIREQLSLFCTASEPGTNENLVIGVAKPTEVLQQMHRDQTTGSESCVGG